MNVRDYWREKGASVRLANALANRGLANPEQVREYGREALLRIPNIGRSSIGEIEILIGWQSANIREAIDSLSVLPAFIEMGSPHGDWCSRMAKAVIEAIARGEVKHVRIKKD
jgi:hypothetical protein